MTQPLHLIWRNPTTLLKGYDVVNSSWQDLTAGFGPAFPGEPTEPQLVFLQSSGLSLPSYDILTAAKLKLVADAATQKLLLEDWPAQQSGIEVSLDEKATWQTLTTTPIPLGTISSFDVVRIWYRARVPDLYTAYGRLTFSFTLEFDVR